MGGMIVGCEVFVRLIDVSDIVTACIYKKKKKILTNTFIFRQKNTKFMLFLWIKGRYCLEVEWMQTLFSRLHRSSLSFEEKWTKKSFNSQEADCRLGSGQMSPVAALSNLSGGEDHHGKIGNSK